VLTHVFVVLEKKNYSLQSCNIDFYAAWCNKVLTKACRLLLTKHQQHCSYKIRGATSLNMVYIYCHHHVIFSTFKQSHPNLQLQEVFWLDFLKIWVTMQKGRKHTDLV